MEKRNMKLIFDINEAGINNLLEGMENFALENFREGMAKMKNCIDEEEALYNERPAPANSSSLALLSCKSLPAVALPPLGSFIFNKAFTIENFENDKSHGKCISSVLMFNLAVSNHVLGLKLGQAKHLSLAMKFYEFALLLYEELVRSNENYHKRNYIFIMAIYNNMGQICHECGEYTISYRYFEAIGTALKDENDSISPTTFQNNELVLNSIVLMHPTHARSA